MGTHMPTASMDMTAMDPGGIWNLGPMCLFMIMACETVKVDCWAADVKQMIPDAQMGRTLITHFTSSISWMLHSVHLLLGVGVPSMLSSPFRVIAALFSELN